MLMPWLFALPYVINSHGIGYVGWPGACAPWKMISLFLNVTYLPVGGGACSSVRLCEAFIQTYDAVAMRPTEQSLGAKVLVFTAFKALLASSSAARLAAMKGKSIPYSKFHGAHQVGPMNLAIWDGFVQRLW